MVRIRSDIIPPTACTCMCTYQCRCWLRRELGLYRAPACSVARFGQTCKSRTRVSGPQSLITHPLHQLSLSRSRAEASAGEEETSCHRETYRLGLQTVMEGMSTCRFCCVCLFSLIFWWCEDTTSTLLTRVLAWHGMAWLASASAHHVLFSLPRFGSHAVCVVALSVTPVSNRP